MLKYSAYHETIKLLSEKGEIYRKLTDYGIIEVSGENLNSDMILAHKQEIYYHDKDKYPGYFNKKEIHKLDFIIPTIIKPDITDNIESLFIEKNWDMVMHHPI